MPSSPRRQGGQPDSLNALKHGFYTRCFRKHDLSGVDSTNLKNLAEEIALIRIFTRRVVEETVKDPDYIDIVAVLRAICLASATITRIIKTQSFLANDPHAFSSDIDEAIRQVRIEFGLDRPPAALEEEPSPE
jgi:hypothetical protein